MQRPRNSRSFGHPERSISLRNKTAAGLLALFAGWAGIHRFYLGQTGLGILYFMLMFVGVSFVLGIIDAIVLLSMSEAEFNRKYNADQGMVPPIYHRRTQGGYPPPIQRRGPRFGSPVRNMKIPDRIPQNPHKLSGIKKYKDFDLEGAIEDFKKGLEMEPKDIALHFNIACAYSLTEQVDLAYSHLDRAVALGFNDFEKIQTHDDLAFVRIQDRWDEFKANGFLLKTPPLQAAPPPAQASSPEDAPATREIPVQDDALLTQLKRLADLRDRGLLSEQEFNMEKRKLTR